MSPFKRIREEEWIAKIQKERKGADPAGIINRKTLDGFFLRILHTTAQRASVSFPTSAAWQKCQVYRSFHPQKLNEALLRDLSGGCNGAVIQLDAGLSNNQPFCGDGASLWSIEGWEQALDGVYLEAMPVHIVSGSASFCVGATLLAWLEERGIKNLEIYYGLDPLGSLAQSGLLLESMSSLYQKCKDFYDWVHPMQPGSRVFRVSSEPYHMAGAGRVRELSIVIATIAEYLRHTDIAPAELAAQLALYIPMGRDIFENIAMLRATRLLYTHLFDACGVQSTPYIHAQTSRRMLSIYDPWVNMLRSTTAGFSAAVGKADSISILPYDDRLQTHTELGARVARNTHHLLSDECQLDQLFDPGAGSYYIENYTSTLAEQAWEGFQRIESQGGLYTMLKKRSIHALLEESWATRRKQIVRGKIAIVGCNLYPQAEDVPRIQKPDIAAETKRISEYYLARGPSDTIGGSSIVSMLPLIKDGVTTIELIEGIFYFQKMILPPLPVRYDAEPFETLRAQPTAPIHLVKLGSEAEWSPRAQFAEQLFCCAGISCAHHHIPYSENLTQAIQDYIGALDTPVVCLCAPDAYYAEPDRIQTLTANQKLILVGRPQALPSPPWLYIYRGCDIVETLQTIISETA